MAGFDDWAEYYDIIHNGLPGEAEFYVWLAVRMGRRALELGAGTGRIAIPMAMSGVDVLGLDNSVRMLEVCLEKKRAVGSTSGKLALVCADMVDFDLDAQFPLIAMAYRTFMHLLTQDDQRKCLSAVRRHLSDEGIFTLNTWVPKASHLTALAAVAQAGIPKPAGRYPVPGTEITLVHYYSATCNENSRLLHEKHLIQEVDENGNILREVTLPLVRAWSTPEEIHDLARLCGFEVQALYGDFECNPLSDDSTEMIWLLKKSK